MARRRNTLIRALTTAGALVLAAAISIGVGACSSAATIPTPTVSVPTGTSGAVHFDDGFIQVGSGAKTVDVYFDPMCPYCQEFDLTNGATLAGAVADGTATVRLHPLMFLDPSSSGTQYSSRASAALTCVAESTPDATLDYLTALYKNQPKEGSDGLPDKKLVSMATALGVPDISSCLATGANQAWAQSITQHALAGPIKNADITQIKGTPTVLVNGISYGGSITDEKAFAKFLDSH
ncbi:DsbA family protein [Diaminobutyricibacter tongyongensis]|uniref:DsbA family protein n=1 Tax=Leifsonia tongyongensis TaxID=1268043 RepID=A0A6L9XZ86_9MICO|nr:DsbA family protein [Diaminobutyricibacter tongyongensis]NEN06298.1 DsbA family protein [Diaminobutyricibacter tongyongensis]